MNQRDKEPSDTSNLHWHTEKQASAVRQTSPAPRSFAEALRTIQELGMQQIELQKQNDELRQRQVELEAARTRYFDLYDLAPAGYLTVSEPGLILEANLNCARLLGVKQKSLVGRLLTSYFLDEETGIYHSLRQRLIATDAQQVAVLQIVRPDDTRIWARLEAVKSKTADGTHVFLIAVCDVTQCRQEEEALQHSIAMLACVGNNTPDRIFVKDSAGRVLYANPSSLQSLELSAEQVFGRTATEWHSTLAEAKVMAAHDNEVFELGKTVVAEEEFTYSAGTRTFLVTKSPFRDATGQIVGLVGVSRDITERKTAMDALCVSEARYRALFDNMAEAFALCELLFDESGAPCDFRFLEVNAAYEKLSGHKVSDLLGKTGQEVYHGLHKGPLDLLVRSIKAEQSTPFEIFIPVTGKFLEGCIYRPATGMAAALLRDVTARKRAEEALRTNEALMRTFIEHAPAALAMFDREMCYLQASRRWIKNHDLGNMDLRGRSHYEVFPNLPERWKDTDRRCLAGEVLSLDADRFVKADGSVKWVRWEVRPWYGAAGEIGGIVIFSEDMTEQLYAQEALQKSEECFRMATAATHVVVYDMDIVTQQLNHVNGIRELLGYEPGEYLLTHQWWRQQIHPDDLAKHLLAFDRLRSGEQGRALEYRILHKDGRTLTVEDNGIPIRDQNGALVRFVGTVVDITKRKQAEDQLRALSASLQTAAERERLRIARDLHDQLGSALTGLKMDLAWIVRKYGKESQECFSLLLETIKTVDSTVAMVRRIATDLRPEMLDSIGLPAAIELYAAQFQRRTGILCSVHVPNDRLGLSSDQKIAVFRIFQETLTNIARHSQAKHVLIQLERKEASASLIVTDDGIGFSLDIQAPTKSLGVAGMRERAHLLGAEFQMTSTPGAGTTITLHIPIEEAEVEEA